MNSRNVLDRLAPSATNMIRMDHSHVMVTFHKYTRDASPEKKKAIVTMVCLALQIHAQLEEEIFYPALDRVQSDNAVLEKSVPEHSEMRRLIASLRGMEPGDPGYDDTFYELMRDVMHHVADEETVLLPVAERLLRDDLAQLGAQMTRRRLQLAAPHSAEIAMNTARTMPAMTMLVLGGVLAGSVMLARRAVRPSSGTSGRQGRPRLARQPLLGSS
jgi:hemerythrin superfamily protein